MTSTMRRFLTHRRGRGCTPSPRPIPPRGCRCPSGTSCSPCASRSPSSTACAPRKGRNGAPRAQTSGQSRGRWKHPTAPARPRGDAPGRAVVARPPVRPASPPHRRVLRAHERARERARIAHQGRAAAARASTRRNGGRVPRARRITHLAARAGALRVGQTCGRREEEEHSTRWARARGCARAAPGPNAERAAGCLNRRPDENGDRASRRVAAALATITHPPSLRTPQASPARSAPRTRSPQSTASAGLGPARKRASGGDARAPRAKVETARQIRPAPVDTAPSPRRAAASGGLNVQSQTRRGAGWARGAPGPSRGANNRRTRGVRGGEENGLRFGAVGPRGARREGAGRECARGRGRRTSTEQERSPTTGVDGGDEGRADAQTTLSGAARTTNTEPTEPTEPTATRRGAPRKA